MKTKMKNKMIWMGLVLVMGCGDQSTTGKRVVLKTQLKSDLSQDRTFVTSRGWSVTLTRAALATGSLYYFDGEPAFVRGKSWSFIKIAQAHPGHYVAGRAIGQMLQPASADLLAGETTLAVGDGISGNARSATFSLSDPGPRDTGPPLIGHSVSSAGTATKDGKTVHFALMMTFAELVKTARAGQITGCLFDGGAIDGDGTVTVTVRPRVWFNLVDFVDLNPGTPENPTTPAEDSTARIAFALGVGQLSAYSFSYSPTPQ